jgi:hypothetical protein
MGSGYIDLCFLDLGSSWKLIGQLHVPADLQPWKRPRNYQLDRMLGGPQSRYGRYVFVKILNATGTESASRRLSNP